VNRFREKTFVAYLGWRLILPLLVVCSAAAQNYTDPDSPAVNAAAHEALSRAKVLDIVGVTSGIQGVLQDLEAKVTDQEVRIALSSDVLFDFDRYTLRHEAAATLRKVGQVAASYPRSTMTIEGHTDGKGTHSYNMKLSEDRAASVKSWLVQNAGIRGARISTRGWGETKPVVPNKKPDGSDDPAGRQKNRRVEIVLRKTG
jgi:outer membrane protein OmpA-like peptidoglycan-associated protein